MFQVDSNPDPLATTSGLMRPSSAGPAEENEVIDTPSSLIAPTVMTFLALPKWPMLS